MVKVCDVNSVTSTNFEIGVCKRIEYLNIFSQDSKISFTKELIDFSSFRPLVEFFDVSVGVQESTDKVSKKKASSSFPAGTGVFVISNHELARLNLQEEEKKIIKKYLDSSDVSRYSIHFNNQYLIYSDNAAREKIHRGIYPNIKQHLDHLKQFITSSNRPYGLHRPREQRFFESPKLICKTMFSRPSFTLDDKSYYVGFSFSLIVARQSDISIKYLLGLLNSNFANYWFHLHGKKRGGDLDVGVGVYRQFPVAAESSSQTGTLIAAKEESERIAIQRQIDATDRQIDQLVYKLYGLTDGEIDIVEGSKE